MFGAKVGLRLGVVAYCLSLSSNLDPLWIVVAAFR